MKIRVTIDAEVGLPCLGGKVVTGLQVYNWLSANLHLGEELQCDNPLLWYKPKLVGELFIEKIEEG